MLSSPKKKLLFIQSPTHNLKAIESFLTKRNYDVYFETDLKKALLRISETQADYVFVALDHTNSKISLIPNIISQSTQSYVIPYVQSSSKEAIRQLDFSGFTHKIYPPLSGPPIERLVLKLTKEFSWEADAEAQATSTSVATSNEDIIRINTKLLESLDQDAEPPSASPSAASMILIQKGTRGELLKTKNQELQQLEKSSLSVERKEKLKLEFDAKIRSSLEDMIETYTDFGNSPGAANDLVIEKGPDNRSRLSVPTDSSPTSARKPSVNEPAANTGRTGKVFHEGNPDAAFSLSHTLKTRSLMSEQEFKDKRTLTQSSVHDLIEAETTSNATSSPDANGLQMNSAASTKVYCLTLQSSNWCGYLVVYSDYQIDFSTSQTLFKNWLTGNLENLTDLEDTEQFEVEISHPDFKSWAKENAEYYESVGIAGNEILLSFFSVDPRSLIIEMNEKDLIEMPIEIVPVDRELNLSVYLHLPENRKYLLYAKEKQTLSSAQKTRLADKSIDKLYTPQEFEKEYRKLIAENHLQNLFKTIVSDGDR